MPNLTIGPPVIKSLRKHTNLPFDVHLMIDPVHKYIKTLQMQDQILLLFIKRPKACWSLSIILKFNKKVGVSLNPNRELKLLKMF